jgi:hypothetical protein
MQLRYLVHRKGDIVQNVSRLVHCYVTELGSDHGGRLPIKDLC